MEVWMVVVVVLAAISVCGLILFKQMQSEEMRERDPPDKAQ